VRSGQAAGSVTLPTVITARWHNRGVSTQTLDAPKTSDADTGDRVFHYVKKNKVAESAVLGTMVEALCGEVFPVTRSPKPGSPVCPACKEIYESLPAGPS
jgi:Protein of unknown function (DUF3039)